MKAAILGPEEEPDTSQDQGCREKAKEYKEGFVVDRGWGNRCTARVELRVVGWLACTKDGGGCERRVKRGTLGERRQRLGIMMVG